MPQMMPIRVVLPAPLGPSKAKISPSRMSRLMALEGLEARRIGLRQAGDRDDRRHRPADDGADDEGVVRSSMRNVPDTGASAASSEAVGHLAARVKTRAMRWATGCCEMHPWRLGTVAAALLGARCARRARRRHQRHGGRVAARRGLHARGELPHRGRRRARDRGARRAQRARRRRIRVQPAARQGDRQGAARRGVRQDRADGDAGQAVRAACSSASPAPTGSMPISSWRCITTRCRTRCWRPGRSTGRSSTTTTASRAIRCSSPTPTRTAPAASRSRGSSASPSRRMACSTRRTTRKNSWATGGASWSTARPASTATTSSSCSRARRMPAALLEAGSIVNRGEELAARHRRARGDHGRRRGRGGRCVLHGARQAERRRRWWRPRSPTSRTRRWRRRRPDEVRRAPKVAKKSDEGPRQRAADAAKPLPPGPGHFFVISNCYPLPTRGIASRHEK